MWQRWNQTTHIFENSTDDGGSWVPTPLSGSIISEGTVVDARLSSNVALKNIDNAFSADQTIGKTRAEMRLLHTGSTMYSRHQQYVTGNGAWFVNGRFNGSGFDLDDTGQPMNLTFSLVDSVRAFEWYTASAGANPRTLTGIFQILRSGAFFERGRATACGEWTSYTPTVSVTSGAGTITGGVIAASYRLVGKSMSLRWRYSNYGILTANVFEIAISLPPGFALTAAPLEAICCPFNAAATGLWESSLVYGAVSETKIRIERLGGQQMTPAASGYYTWGQVEIEIA